MGDLVAKVEAEGDKPLLPVVDEFRRLIEEDPEVYMLFRFMLKQVPYHKSPTHEPQVKTVEKMPGLFNYVMTHARSTTTPAWWVFRSTRSWTGRWARRAGSPHS